MKLLFAVVAAVAVAGCQSSPAKVALPSPTPLPAGHKVVSNRGISVVVPSDWVLNQKSIFIYDDVSKASEAWVPKAKSDGTLAGHSIVEGFGLKKAGVLGYDVLHFGSLNTVVVIQTNDYDETSAVRASLTVAGPAPTRAADPGMQWVSYGPLLLQAPADWKVNHRGCGALGNEVYTPYSGGEEACTSAPGPNLVEILPYEARNEKTLTTTPTKVLALPAIDLAVSIAVPNAALRNRIAKSVQISDAGFLND